MYAIVKTGGKQYRVEQGQTLLVERLPVNDGGKLSLEPLLYVDGSEVVDGEGLQQIRVEARVVGHERGQKLRVVKFKPKRGYKRRTGHRQELTRIEVTSLKRGARRGGGRQRAQSKQEAPNAGARSKAAQGKGEAPSKAGGRSKEGASSKAGARSRAPKTAARDKESAPSKAARRGKEDANGA